MKRLLTGLVAMALLATSCTELSRNKEIKAYRAENKIRMQKLALKQVYELKQIRNQLKQNYTELDLLILQGDSINLFSYQKLRQNEVYNNHFIVIYRDKLQLENVNFLKRNEIMAGNDNEKNRY